MIFDSVAEGAAAGGAAFPVSLGRYRLLERLGEGAMGAVYLAHDSQLDRRVALKIPKFDQEARPELLERFFREARAAAVLRHPNICPVFDVGECDGVRYISMAYIEGQPLSALVASGAPLDQELAARMIEKLARALQEAHDQGIVHRDLKPGNCIVDRRGEPVILDFGLARRYSSEGSESTRLTQVGVTMGTPAYMSPEQVNQPDAVGPPSDQYSLGVVFYELVTGQVPFKGSVASVIGQIATQEPRKPGDLRNDLDLRLETICQRMMAKRIEDRYGSMAEVAQALDTVIAAGIEKRTRVLLDIDDNVGLADVTGTIPAYRPPKVLAAADAETAGDVQCLMAPLKAKRTKAAALCKEKQYVAALKLLNEIAAVKHPELAAVAAWARRQVPNITARAAETQRESESALRAGLKAYKQRAFEQAVKLLRRIPESYRTPECRQLLARCVKYSARVKLLAGEIDKALDEQQFDIGAARLDELLKLQPAHPQAQQWQEQLARKRRGRKLF
ncbi:MAG: serine/threonine protein kinase [Planctomycetes bacterium]|nr:serine/threonine protein kinase [Planctomycetota bacterium]